jgi:hypothetical protein
MLYGTMSKLAAEHKAKLLQLEYPHFKYEVVPRIRTPAVFEWGIVRYVCGPDSSIFRCEGFQPVF